MRVLQRFDGSGNVSAGNRSATQCKTVHHCLGFQQKNRDDRFICRVVSSSSFGSHWVREEKTPGQNRELAEQITSEVQRGEAIEDTVKGVICHEQTERKQRREDQLWAGSRRQGRQRRGPLQTGSQHRRDTRTITSARGLRNHCYQNLVFQMRKSGKPEAATLYTTHTSFTRH